jgi:hypothetical protein
VVHRDERAAQRERERFRERHADQERPDQPRSLRHRNRIDVFELCPGGLERRPHDAADVADMLARRELGHHASPLAMDGRLRGHDIRADGPDAVLFGDDRRGRFVARGLDAEHQHRRRQSAIRAASDSA